MDKFKTCCPDHMVLHCIWYIICPGLHWYESMNHHERCLPTPFFSGKDQQIRPGLSPTLPIPIPFLLDRSPAAESAAGVSRQRDQANLFLATKSCSCPLLLCCVCECVSFLSSSSTRSLRLSLCVPGPGPLNISCQHHTHSQPDLLLLRRRRLLLFFSI